MSAATTRERLHSGLGVGLVVLACVDLGVVRVALRGREAFATLVGRPGVFAGSCLVCVGAMAIAHALLGLLRAADPSATSAHGDASIRSLQRLTGLAAAPFVLTRIVGSPLAASFFGFDGFGLYQAMRDDLTLPPLVAVCCIGIAAVAVHVHQGLSALGRRMGMRRHTPFALLLAAGYFLGWLDVLAYFVTGRALVSF